MRVVAIARCATARTHCSTTERRPHDLAHPRRRPRHRSERRHRHAPGRRGARARCRQGLRHGPAAARLGRRARRAPGARRHGSRLHRGRRRGSIRHHRAHQQRRHVDAHPRHPHPRRRRDPPQRRDQLPRAALPRPGIRARARRSRGWYRDHRHPLRPVVVRRRRHLLRHQGSPVVGDQLAAPRTAARRRAGGRRARRLRRHRDGRPRHQPQARPRADLVTQIFDTLEAGGYEVLADQTSVQAKAGLSAPLEVVYPQLAGEA